MFFCEFGKIFKGIFSFDRTPQDDYFTGPFKRFIQEREVVIPRRLFTENP